MTRNLPTRLTSILGVVCGLLLLSPVFADAQKFELKPNYQPGMSWTFDQTMRCDTHNTASAGNEITDIREKTTHVRKGTMQVLAVKDGMPTELRITFDPTCGNRVNSNGREQAQPFALAGQTVALRKDADGNITNDFKGQLDQATLTAINGTQPFQGPNGPMNLEVSSTGKLDFGGSNKPIAGQPVLLSNVPPATPASPFSGSFKGDKLSMQIKSGTGGQCTGTIQLGGKSFPFFAQANGNKLDGIFQSGGDHFAFIATFDNGTITLTSGGTTYTLTQSGNPLEQK